MQFEYKRVSHRLPDTSRQRRALRREGQNHSRARERGRPRRNARFGRHRFFVDEADAISCAKAWAIEWCDENLK